MKASNNINVAGLGEGRDGLELEAGVQSSWPQLHTHATSCLLALPCITRPLAFGVLKNLRLICHTFHFIDSLALLLQLHVQRC